MRLRIVAVAIMAALAAGPANAAMGVLDSVELGVLDHDIAIGTSHREPGADVNTEIRFVSPGWLAPLFAPRPHLGFEANTSGGNSYGYGGLTWEVPFGSAFFADLGLGGAVHTGPDTVSRTTTDRKGLGTRALFHESVDLGYHLTRHWSFAAYIDHVSNADLGSHNPGITNLGARVGYSF
jgi:lipid A 3-O-deacylase